MELTIKQEQGLKIAKKRFFDHDKYTVISGFAGSGKSTLIRFIIDSLEGMGIKEDDVCYACYTGKACQVLLKMGNKNVSTLHKLLYESIPTIDGRWIRKPKASLAYKVIIVDEISMVPKALMELLFKHNVHVICLGDSFQLPPIDKDSDNKLLSNPHIFLDEIMRQAADSEIIQFATKVRQFEPLPDHFSGKEVQILNHNELNTGMLMWADQILVGTNATRISLNSAIRKELGRGERPEDGDKVICLRNYWDDLSDNCNPLVNGTIGYINNSYESFIQLPYWVIKNQNIRQIPIINAEFTSDNNENYGNFNMDKKLILEGEKSLNWKTSYLLGKSEKTKHLVPYEFTYGYAITTWKAQGSQWGKVLVYEEGFPYDKITHAKFLYTSITRAQEKIVLLR